MGIKSEVVSVHMDAQLKEAISTLAKFDGRSVSQYIERALVEHASRADRRAALNLMRRQGAVLAD